MKMFIFNTCLASEAVARNRTVKKVFEKFRKIHRKTPVLESLFKTVADTGVSCKFCEIFENNFF